MRLVLRNADKSQLAADQSPHAAIRRPLAERSALAGRAHGTVLITIAGEENPVSVALTSERAKFLAEIR